MHIHKPYFTQQNLARLSVFYEVYYILTRRYGRTNFCSIDFAKFAARTRNTAIHVAIKNKIQHIARISPISRSKVSTHRQNFLNYQLESHILDGFSAFGSL